MDAEAAQSYLRAMPRNAKGAIVTPEEKEQKAYEQTQRMQALNKKLREMGVGIADPNDKTHYDEAHTPPWLDEEPAPTPERPATEEGEERYGWNRQLSHASQVWVLREEAESHFDAFVEGQEDAREDLRAQLVAAEHSRDVLHGQIAAAQAEVAELKEEKEQKRKDRADGWWLDLNLEELREEFACLEELECENQAAVAELGAQCLEKSTDGIWTLGNMLHDERAKVSRLEEDLGKCGVEMEKDRLEIERLRKENARISEYANQTTENLLATAYANERFREELARLREMVKVAVDALENIAPHNMKYSGSCDNQRASCWEKEARRLAEAAREALARLRSGKDGGKKDG